MPTLILLATYNGAAHIASQWQSLRAQTDTDWRLLVRDDGSSDGTTELLAAFAASDPRVEIIPPDGQRLGARGSFARLMQAAAARSETRVAFCDQDDAWLPEKLAIQLAVMSELEAQYGAHTPLLVHSDVKVVDEALKPLSASMMRLQHINAPAEAPISTLLAQNHVVGCTAMINRPLLELAVPVPDNAHMHDWWVALCAEFVGARRYIPTPLVLYRQHQGNSIGAVGPWRRLARIRQLPAWFSKMNRINRTTWVQAVALRQRLDARLQQPAEPRYQLLKRFTDLHQRGAARRLLGLLRLPLRAQNFPMTMLYYGQATFFRSRDSERPRGGTQAPVQLR